MNKLLLLTINFLFSLSFFSQSDLRQTIDLKGSWKFALDVEDIGIGKQFYKKDFQESVQLPGTTDTNRKGFLNSNKEETTNLSRIYKYEGAAWYSKEVVIPNDWNNKEIILFLERTRPSKVWVDSQLVGENKNISTPQRYNLTNVLRPGKHKITIRVDNGESIPEQIRSSSHACTESTQTNWNGIIGEIQLTALNKLHIKSIYTYPNIESRSVRVKIELSDVNIIKDQKVELSAQAFNSKKEHKVPDMSFSLEKGRINYEVVFPLGNEALFWSEFDPVLYRLTVSIKDIDSKSVNFGLRHFEVKDTQFYINGSKIILRGKHDACVFPLTAHTPMDLESWRKYFRIIKSYGLNHCRFHSWCPPEVCFNAADLEGIYLQPELPIWGTFEEKEKYLLSFLAQDGENIHKEYRNHASFVMFTLGNELSGDENVMKSFINNFKAINNQILYAYGSNNFLGFKGYIPGEDFTVTCRVGWGEGYTSHARGSFSFADADDGGYINHCYPNSQLNFSEAITKSPVPVISHETGQYQIYPNYEEMKKYTGVLMPWNFEIFRQRLQKAGMLDQAEDFFRASGALSALLYKADIEMCLRTGKLGGFQLLDLQDYPGQGSAYVGILDAFMDSKGLISPEEWRQFCNDVVPLLETEKFCWTNNEVFNGKIKIANYSDKDLSGKSLNWELTSNGEKIDNGQMDIPCGKGLLSLKNIDIPLVSLTKNSKISLKLEVSGTSYCNNYPLWVYVEDGKTDSCLSDIMQTDKLDERVFAKLAEGGKVLLIPNRELSVQTTVGGLFQTDYWNYRMFKTICDRAGKLASPGTLGILTNPDHPLYKDFPTEFHSNWQWFPIVKSSYPMILDKLPKGYKPIIQVIDNVERNHKLGLVFEFKIGNGYLLVCMADLNGVKDKPEVRQFLRSIYDYVNSEYFAPTQEIDVDALKQLFETKSDADNIEALENISYE